MSKGEKLLLDSFIEFTIIYQIAFMLNISLILAVTGYAIGYVIARKTKHISYRTVFKKKKKKEEKYPLDNIPTTADIIEKLLTFKGDFSFSEFHSSSKNKNETLMKTVVPNYTTFRTLQYGLNKAAIYYNEIDFFSYKEVSFNFKNGIILEKKDDYCIVVIDKDWFQVFNYKGRILIGSSSIEELCFIIPDYITQDELCKWINKNSYMPLPDVLNINEDERNHFFINFIQALTSTNKYSSEKEKQLRHVLQIKS